MLRNLVFTAIAAAFLIPVSGPVLAQTPDTFTPAEEYVCDSVFDDLSFGICNAYCEAMDCDNPDRVKANDKACLAHARKWEKIAGPIPLPCNENATISLTKSVNAADPERFITVGDPVEYTFTIKNEGNVSLTDIILVDDTLSAAALLDCTTAISGVELDWQAPNNEIVCDTTGVFIDAVAGYQLNKADVSAVSVFGTAVDAHSETDYTGLELPQVTCPCFEPADLAAIDGKYPNGDLKAGFNCSGVTNSTRVQAEEWETVRFGSDPFAITVNITNDSTFMQCNYRDNTGASDSKFLRVQDGTITLDQVAECFAQVVAHNTDTAICDGNRAP